MRNGITEAATHSRPASEILNALEVGVQYGLTVEQVETRQRVFGGNQLRSRRAKSSFRILINQFESPVVWLLAGAAAIAWLFGEWKESLAVIAVLAINTCIGFVTERRAARSMEALRQLGSLHTRVRRDGHASVRPATELVPGDIVLLEGGDIVTADMRLVEASSLYADESALTGESISTAKNTEPVPDDTVLGDRSPMVFKGTSITRGSGVGVVVATGMNSELGKISNLVEEAAPEHSPLEKQLQRLSGELIWFTLVVVSILGLTGIYSGRDTMLMVQSAIALAVAAIPEGLPVVATMALARGMWRMARQNALIERLSAVETLGATTVIFTDKTGTLTENRLQLREVDISCEVRRLEWDTGSFTNRAQGTSARDDEDLDLLLNAVVLCNNAELGRDSEAASGDPLEIALLEAATTVGKSQLELTRCFPRVREQAFDSKSKLMATVHKDADRFLFCVKGAPEEVIEHSITVLGNEGPIKMDAAARRKWLDRTKAMAARGMRVLAVATKHSRRAETRPYTELTLLGLLGLYDPPRTDVPAAIANCHQAGIRVIMVTGDHAVTARNIATMVGLVENDARIVEGRHMPAPDALTQEDKATLLRADIFARVSPEQKLELISLYQQKGEIVAMTGDGVNDAPALKKADIGIAMGLRGTQVAREAAAMVLRDDAFKTIVTAIREGRVIFRNIQRFITYLLSCNLSEIMVVGAAILIGLPLPLLPLQILFLNLVTDVFPAFALGLGEQGSNVMAVSPRNPKKPILTRAIWIELVYHSFVITFSTLAALALARGTFHLAREEATTVSFLTLALAQLWHVFNARDFRSRLFNNAVTRNKYVWAALGLSSALLLMAVYLKPLAEVLQLYAPTPEVWAMILLMSVIPLLFGQILKFLTFLLHQSRTSSLDRG